jgi:hypothetical protein
VGKELKMPRIEKPVAYLVEIVESERGWGSKVEEQIYFDNELEARLYSKVYNDKHNPPLPEGAPVPDWYMMAFYRGAC